jgi:beta-galactosidase
MKITAKRVSLVWIISVVMGFLFVGLSHAAINPKSIAGIWLFDQEDDIVEDRSGNANHGQLMGNVEFVNGKFGRAIELDGSSYISVPDSDSLDMTEQVTVMFWVRTEKAMVDMWADRQVVVGKHYTEYEVGIYMGGQLHTYTSDGAGNYDEGIMTTMAGVLPDKDADWEESKWYHVAWTLDGANEVAYVNGIKLGEHVKAHENTRPGANPLEIGRRVGGSLPLLGAVDEVIILNELLDEETIMDVAERGLEAVLGWTAVSSAGKLTTSWGDVKSR